MLPLIGLLAMAAVGLSVAGVAVSWLFVPFSLLATSCCAWLATLNWLRTAAPDDLTVAYLMGREDETRVRQGEKPMVRASEAEKERLIRELLPVLRQRLR